MVLFVGKLKVVVRFSVSVMLCIIYIVSVLFYSSVVRLFSNRNCVSLLMSSIWVGE